MLLVICFRREPDDTKSAETDRDVFNEKPSKEDIISATEATGDHAIYSKSTSHSIIIMFFLLNLNFYVFKTHYLGRCSTVYKYIL